MPIATAHDEPFPFNNSYARLPERFFAQVSPTPVANPQVIRLNESLARELGLNPETLRTAEGVAVLGGNRVPENADPLAMAYAGFQFGHWVPQLGDGRAILLGELLGQDGVRRDIQLKGAGATPFSRGGDGRAGVGPVIREYVVSEAMYRLGVPTTRALAAVTTGEKIVRERLLPGAVLTRVARSHIRVGTFQFFAGRRDDDALQTLADYAIARHDPAAAAAEQPYLTFFRGIAERQAALVAQWQLVGFVHGVMNTDNTSIAGETIDYGPCAFLDGYHPETVFSSIDRLGRYAFGRQPSVTQWNLQSLARALLPLFAEDEAVAVAGATEVLEHFQTHFDAVYLDGMRRKLGLTEARDDDRALAETLLLHMADSGADFTLTFRGLCDALETSSTSRTPVSRLFQDSSGFGTWLNGWRERLATESCDTVEQRDLMRAANPRFIPRNHLLEEVIEAATTRGDFDPLHALVEVLDAPYEDQPGHERYARAPEPEQVVHQTFCGT